jgi:sialidase-1
VHEEGGDAAIKFGNPNPIIDHERGVILLLMNRSEGKTREERSGGDIFQSISKDNGKSWSEPRDITSQVKKPQWRSYALGPGIGIQLQHGPHKGRLIAPANYRVTFSNQDPSYSHVIYSDDHGEHWKLGGIVGEHTNECQVVETYADGKSGFTHRHA